MADTTFAYRRTSDLPPAIFRHWMHSREEDAEGVEVFRPEDFGFPPSFGRDGFEMHKNGVFIQEDIGPADGVVRVRGRWTLTGPRVVVVSLDEAATREGFTFEVVAVDETVLRNPPRSCAHPPGLRELAGDGRGIAAGLPRAAAGNVVPEAGL